MRGTGTYPTDWPAISFRTKEAAGWRCVRCRHLDSPQLCTAAGVMRGYLRCDGFCLHADDGRRRVLTVHHLDGDKSNCRWWNLPPLCQVCHLEVQGKVHMAQVYLHPHSEWFRPYVAGYYAFTVLGEDLLRVEVEERLEGLLRAGQPWLPEVQHA